MPKAAARRVLSSNESQRAVAGLPAAGLILTIESDDDIAAEVEEDEEDESVEIRDLAASKKKQNKQKPSTFQLDFEDGHLVTSDVTDEEQSMDEMAVDSESCTSDDAPAVEDNVRIMPHSEERLKRAAVKLQKKRDREADGQPQQQYLNEWASGDAADQNKDFFEKVVAAQIDGGTERTQFSQLSLSRPLLRAVERIGYVEPTPIQAEVIPYALAGKDICASAETGSGKTAAFVLPFMERLLYRPRDIACIRVLVVTPTRELASQIHAVLQQLSQFTDITCCLVCGGKKDVRSQEATLRQRPDVVICTPGRMVDHLRNSPSVHLGDLDVLVLDEADRLLELGFEDEVSEILKYCPAGTTAARQTMLFSATMTSRVEDLVKLSLKRPVRVRTTGTTINFAARLVQEFVKIRSTDAVLAQQEIEATLLALICRSFHVKTIVFFEMKKQAHRFCALLHLVAGSSVRAAELHGDMPQQQRYQALQQFRSGAVDVLLATDVAARGLDVPGVQTVINAEMPRNPSIYVHRVGRTARAGCGGRAVTLVADNRRAVMKEVLKGESAAAMQQQSDGAVRQVLSRTVPAAVLAYYIDSVQRLEQEIGEQMRREREQRKLDALERDADRAVNLLQHEEEIRTRPARTWHETETQKQKRRERSRAVVADERKIAAGEDVKTHSTISAQEKAVAFATRDEYPLEKKVSVKAGAHRLTRKKRRRQEALQELAAEAEAQEEAGQESNKISLEALPKRAKVTTREREMQKKERIIGEIGMKRRQIIPTEGEGDNAAKSGTKVVRQNFAVGGLDQDFLAWGTSATTGSSMSKKQLKDAARERPFTEFDASKTLRKGGKQGAKAFKSKAKYKRRK